MARILIWDDDPGVQTFLQEALTGHSAVCAQSDDDAMAQLARADFDLFLLDLSSEKEAKWAMLTRALALEPTLQVIVLTAYGARKSGLSALRRGAFDYLCKPVSELDELRMVVQRAYEWRVMTGKLSRQGKQALPELVACSAAMRHILALVEATRGHLDPVCITGESGTGKELVARHVHAASRRGHGPFSTLNCAGLSSAACEEKLFGAGALLERTRGGTLYVSSVERVPRALQRKLLEALNDARFRAHDRRVVPVDVRLIISSEHSIEALDAQQVLTRKLRGMIDATVVEIPPLRARKEDIAPLAKVLLDRIARELGRDEIELGEDALAALTRASWPGNVRELRNAIERAAMLCDEARCLRPEHFVRLGASREISDEFDNPMSSLFPRTSRWTLRDIERMAIVNTLRAVQGDCIRAASRLGIGLEDLRDKMLVYDIDVVAQPGSMH